jgi:hypothetical protein
MGASVYAALRHPDKRAGQAERPSHQSGLGYPGAPRHLQSERLVGQSAAGWSLDGREYGNLNHQSTGGADRRTIQLLQREAVPGADNRQLVCFAPP